MTLRGGLVVPVAALRVLWAFEARGLTVRLDDDGGLLVGPRQQLTATDRQTITAYRDQLVQLVKYVDEGIA